MNEVTLFSNGMGHFSREYEIPEEGKEIRLSFDSKSMSDVASSIQVFGKVRQTSPASFTPANSSATALKINSSSAMESLLTNLAGSKVKVKTTSSSYEGDLVGVDTETKTSDSGTTSEFYVSIFSNGTLKRVRLASVQNLEFTEESVQAEIEKALKVSYQKIKPGSTMVGLHLEPKDEATKCRLQYAIPVSSWKMRYSIRQEDGNFTLEGSAIIDNNTDEDWRDFQVSVVTGDPISFRTDLADIVTPTRKFVNIVDQSVVSNVDVHEGRSLESVRGGRKAVMRAQALGAKGAVSMASFDALEACVDSCDDDFEYEAAEVAGASSKDVGDFCVFTCNEPVTILAKNSAIVPMFNVPLSSAGIVLLYNESNNAERPYRALKFKNETEYSLSKGKATIYNDGVLSGECVLTTTKPSENKMLPHSLENGVKIIKNRKTSDTVYSAQRISKGVAYTSLTHTYTTEYIVRNKKDEDFEMALEHQLVGNSKASFSGVEITENEHVAATNSNRVYFDLPSNGEVTLVVTEVVVDQQSLNIGLNRLITWVDDENNPLVMNESISACVELQKLIDAVQEEIDQVNSDVQSIEKRMSTLRSNIESLRDTSVDNEASDWVKKLKELTEKSESLADSIPEKREQRSDLERRLQEALQNVSYDWTLQQPQVVEQ